VLDRTSTHPRDVFREALAGGASAIVMFHNHPSGDPWPSGDDMKMTRRMYDAGELMGITLIDHLVLADNRYYSFRENCMPGMPLAFSGGAIGTNGYGHRHANGRTNGNGHGEVNGNGIGPVNANGFFRGPGVRVFAMKTASAAIEPQLR
jgi:hypothetical protein